MFNLPWYSWFNVLAMPCLWAMLSLNSALALKPAWQRTVLKIQITAAVVVIFLYWNPAVSELFTPLHFMLVLLVLPLLLWNIGEVLLEIFEISWASISAIAKAPDPVTLQQANTNAEQMVMHDVLSADDVDLDGGESPLEREREIGEVISTLFSNRSSTDSIAGSIGKLLGEPDEQELRENGAIYLVVMLAYGLAVSIVLMPAAYMSLSMIGMFN